MAELVVGDVFDKVKMPVVTYDYTQKSEKFKHYKIPNITVDNLPAEAKALVTTWATNPTTASVATLWADLYRIYVQPWHGANRAPYPAEYLYLTCKCNVNSLNAQNPPWTLEFLKYPLRLYQYGLYSFCGKPQEKRSYGWQYNASSPSWPWDPCPVGWCLWVDNGGSIWGKGIDGQDHWSLGNFSPQNDAEINVIYPINGVIMTILDEKGKPIPEFIDPTPTSLTIKQYNNKLILMGVDMMNAKREEWEQKLKTIEFHRQQMLSSTSYAYSTQLSLVRNAQAEEQRSLLNARGEAIYNLELLRQNELSRINGQCDNAVKQVEVKKVTLLDEYELACKQIYIKKKQQDRWDNQKLSAKGKGGGAAESSKSKIFINYQQQMNSVLRDYNSKMDEVEREITEVRQEYEIMRQEKVQEYSLIISDMTMQYNQSCLDAARRYENQIFSITLQMESALFNLNLEYDQLRDAETMYFRHYETEMLAYLEDLRIIELEV